MPFDDVQVILIRIEPQHGHLVVPISDLFLLLGEEKLEIVREISLANNFSCLLSLSIELVDKVCDELLGIDIA